MTNLFKDLPFKLDDKGIPVHIETGRPWNGDTHNGVKYKRSFIKQVLQLQTPTSKRERMSIFQFGGRFFLRSKTGDVHATRYPSREAASTAALKMANGLIHFQPAIKQVLTANLTNRT